MIKYVITLNTATGTVTSFPITFSKFTVYCINKDIVDILKGILVLQGTKLKIVYTQNPNLRNCHYLVGVDKEFTPIRYRHKGSITEAIKKTSQKSFWHLDKF